MFCIGQPRCEESVNADLSGRRKSEFERHIACADELNGELGAVRRGPEGIGPRRYDACDAHGGGPISALGIRLDCGDQLPSDAPPCCRVSRIRWCREAHHSAAQQGGLRRAISEINGVSHLAMIGRAARVRRRAALR